MKRCDEIQIGPRSEAEIYADVFNPRESDLDYLLRRIRESDSRHPRDLEINRAMGRKLPEAAKVVVQARD